jgi:hypothetical protein
MGVQMLSNEGIKKAVMEYWRHAVSCNTPTAESDAETFDFGYKCGAAIRQSFLRIHGEKRKVEIEYVPASWWDHFKKSYLPFLPIKTRGIVTTLQQDFLFPHVHDAAEVEKIMRFFNVK